MHLWDILSRFSQGQGSGDHRCHEGLLLVWGGCSEVSGGLVVGVRYGIFFHGLEPGEQSPPAGNPNILLSRGSQGQGFSGQ